jgi:phosphate acyltransferase
MVVEVSGGGRTRIAVDAMGGDHAPHEIVKGALLAAKEYPVAVLLVGREEVIREHLAKLGSNDPAHVEIVDARDVIEMDESAIAAVRRKRDSSLRVCARLVADGRADAMVSAGSTGATWAAARLVIGMIKGVERPALAAILPRAQGHTVLLDVGAQVDSKPKHLREFAIMGHYYAQMVLGLESPRVGLLSIGEEEGKGNELTKETFRVMQETGLNFIGNAEGRDIYNGNADVVVTDGFAGNAILKASESLAEMMKRLIREEITSSPVRKIGAAILKGAFADVGRRTDYREFGGAPVLGVKGGCIVCHGRSDSVAIKNAIRVAREFAVNRMDAKIADKIAELHNREHESKVLAVEVE